MDGLSHELRMLADGYAQAATNEMLINGEGTEDQRDMEAMSERLNEAAGTIDRLTARIATLKKALARKRCLISWAYYTLKEINVSNYTHDDVRDLNSASVEVILGLKPEIEVKPLGETP